MNNPTASANRKDLADLLRKIARELNRRAGEADNNKDPLTREYIQAVYASLLWIAQEQDNIKHNAGN